MPVVCFSEDQFSFPPLSKAGEDGLLLIGGRVTPDRILKAYSKGIFPWYDDDNIPLWWSPDPRFVLFPEELHVSRSMQKVIRQGRFDFKVNTAFEQVIAACASAPRPGQDGTWITDEIKAAYTELHRKGYAHSAEAWQNGRLVGGVYGVWTGSVFFGESMFSSLSNASKFAFIRWAQHLRQQGVQLIDCQVYTTHVETLGARLIPRSEFGALLEKFASKVPAGKTV